MSSLTLPRPIGLRPIGLGILALFAGIVIVMKGPDTASYSYVDDGTSNWETQGASNCSDAYGAFDAFIPGMRGWGSCTRGGFVPGTTVVKVTNRNATGAGSFANALFNESCPKVILFDVGGLINHGIDGIRANPNNCNQWSVVGASAPGNVVVTGGPTDLKGLVMTNGNNWTIDHVTLASGTTPTGEGDSLQIGDGFGASTGEGMGIVLNSTIIWGRDENLQCWRLENDKQENILLWQNIFAVNMTDRKGVVTQSQYCRWMNSMRNILMHSHERAPFILSEPYFHANNLSANIRERGAYIGPCNLTPQQPVFRTNWYYNLKANTTLSGNNDYLTQISSGCTDVQTYEIGNQVRLVDGTIRDCTNHNCSSGFSSWETSPIAAAYPDGYVPEVITANQANLEAFSIKIANHAGARPQSRLSYTQTRLVDEATNIVNGSLTTSTVMGAFPDIPTLANEGGIDAITPANTSWDVTAQCGGMPTGTDADDIQTSGLTGLHEWVITCFYDNVMPVGYREAL